MREPSEGEHDEGCASEHFFAREHDHSPMHRQRQVARLNPSIAVHPLILGLNPLDLLLLHLDILLCDALHRLELGLAALSERNTGASEEGSRTEVGGDLTARVEGGQQSSRGGEFGIGEEGTYRTT